MRKPIVVSLWSVLLASSLFAGNVDASIVQHIIVGFSPDPTSSSSSIRSADRIEGATDADINRDLLVSIAPDATVPGSQFGAGGSLGRFGNYGIFGRIFTRGRLQSQVLIEVDPIVNLTGIAQRVQAHFIIDGGQFIMTFAPEATLEYTLSLVRDVSGIRFQTHGELAGDPLGVTHFTSRGADIGAVFHDEDTVDIPFSFQSADLGVLGPNESMSLKYQLDIVATVPSFAEGVLFQFEDPFIRPGLSPQIVRPSVTFQPLTGAPVPEPSGALTWLGLAAAAGLGVNALSPRRTRRARRRDSA